MRFAGYIALFVFLTGFISCLPDPLSVEGIPQLKPKIVVSSQIDENGTLLILLTKSIGALEGSEESDIQALLDLIAINDAVVTVSNENFSETLTFLDNGLYSSAFIPLEENTEYFLIVESPSMGSVTSSTFINPQVPFDFLEARAYNDGYDTLAEVRYRFSDPVGKNFYMFNVQRLQRNFESDDLLNPRIFTQLIDDSDFEGGQYSDRKMIFANRDFVPGDTLGVFLSSISQPYYNFIEVRLDSRFSFADFLGEPANYPSNIRGGLGFFNLYIPDVHILELQ